tara:strand:- start:2138 stop:2707 length:570 start_codon:yes stop_codon:yes gene_type:complete
MRFVLTDEFWGLDALTPAEWLTIADLPSIAAGESFSESTRARLFPSPFAPDALLEEDTLTNIEDWQQYVQPDLKDTFVSARDLVSQDLEAVETIDANDFLEPEQIKMAGGVAELRRLRVPLDHADSWYSVLNQARLLMNEEYELAESDDRLLLQLQKAETIDQARILMLAQYELYSAVQSILVENVMEL